MANPIDSVLKGTESQELEIKAILLARDGIERLIAMKASHIRHKDGLCVGAVLVFRDRSEEHTF